MIISENIKEEFHFRECLDYYYYQLGVNVIPAKSKLKRPIVPYRMYLHNPVLPETFEMWKKEDKFKDGFIIILGRIWHGQYEGRYLIGLDIDKELGIKEFCSRNGKTNTLQELSNRTVVEQHKDDLKKAHIYFISPINFPLKGSDTSVGIEVKRYIVPSPNIHANGYRYEVIGEKKEPILLTSEQSIELIRHIDSICITNGLRYLKNEGSKILTEPLRGAIKTLSIKDLHRVIPQGQRHVTLLSFADSLLIKYRNKNKEELKIFFSEVNNKICSPPLDESELNNIWKSAINFVDKLKENISKKTAIQKKIIEKATEIIMSKTRFLTIEESKEILFYDNTGVYLYGGEVLIEKELESLFGFELRSSEISEIKGHIMRKTYVKLE